MTLFRAILRRQGHHGGTWSTFLLGSLFGFFVASSVSGILSLHMFSDDQAQSVEVTTHALRALASVRHFPENNGWGLVHVFYGDNTHLPQSSARANHFSHWFGKFQQDFLVAKVLRGKRGGFFVDLTAGHAYEASKTYALETHYGWNGLCVETDPQHWESLSFRKCDIVGALVGESRMEETQRTQSKAAMKPTSESSKDRLRYTVPLREILERFEAPRVIDYLSMGKEFRHVVFTKFPFDRYRFNVVTIESPTAEILSILQTNGYIKLLELRQSEMVWIHKSIQHTVDKVDMKVLAKTAESSNMNLLPETART